MRSAAAHVAREPRPVPLAPYGYPPCTGLAATHAGSKPSGQSHACPTPTPRRSNHSIGTSGAASQATGVLDMEAIATSGRKSALPGASRTPPIRPSRVGSERSPTLRPAARVSGRCPAAPPSRRPIIVHQAAASAEAYLPFRNTFVRRPRRASLPNLAPRPVLRVLPSSVTSARAPFAVSPLSLVLLPAPVDRVDVEVVGEWRRCRRGRRRG